jgi:hypothetical protein
LRQSTAKTRWTKTCVLSREALGGSGSPKEVIRGYFLNDFYADHCKIYQKRPIYWLFDSGKKGGFKALIYMHRYQPDTIARIRTDYVFEQQARYRTAIADIEQRMASASTAERVKLTKQLQKLQAQDDEIRAYEEKIHHLADQMIPIDLDDGVKHKLRDIQGCACADKVKESVAMVKAEIDMLKELIAKIDGALCVFADKVIRSLCMTSPVKRALYMVQRLPKFRMPLSLWRRIAAW